MRVPNPFESIRRRDPSDTPKNQTSKISKKDQTISQLAAKTVSHPIDLDSAIELDIKLGDEKNLLFRTKKKNEFKMCTIDNASFKKHSTRLEWRTVSVTKDGKVDLMYDDGQPKRRLSVDTFLDLYQPTSPPSQEEFDKAILINQMAHAWGLSGSFNIRDGILLLKTGSYAEECMSTLLDHIDDLVFPEEFSRSLFNQDNFKNDVKIALQQSLELEILINQMRTSPGKWKKVRKKIVKMINHSDKTGIPALISSGYDAHQTYMVYHNQCLSFTNRGSRHPDNPSGTDYFKVDPKRLKEKLCSRSFLERFVGITQKSNFLKFQPYREGESFKGEITEQLELIFLGFDPKSDQKVGNCAFANLISALHSFATMRKYHSRPGFPDEDIVQLANKTKIDHKAFTFAVRTGILDHAARIFSAEDSQFARDYLTACNKMMAKIQNYEEEGKFPRVEDRKKILKLCQYYFERLSTSNKEMSAYYEFINQIIRQHYPGVTEEEAFELLVGRESEWMMIQNEIDKTYSIFYTDSSGSPTKILFPNASVPTIEEFTRRFPMERRVSVDHLNPDRYLKTVLYQEAQKLSVGRISSTEEQILLQGERPGAWLVRESFDEKGQFAVTFVTLDHQIQTWILTPESLSTTLVAFRQQFKPRDQVNPLRMIKKLEEFHSDELKETPMEFEKPVYLSGALKPFKPPHHVDVSIDDIVSIIGENLTSVIPNIEEMTHYLSILLSSDTFSPEEIYELRARLSHVKGDHVHPVEMKEIDHLLNHIQRKKMSIENFKHQMSVLRKAGVETQLIEKIFAREDVPVGSWFFAPSDTDDHTFILTMKLSDSEGRPYIGRMNQPIDDKTPYLMDQFINGEMTYDGVHLDSKLSNKKFSNKLQIKLKQYHNNSDFFTTLKMRSHGNLNQKEAKALLRHQTDTPPLWLVRKSQSTPDAIVLSILDSKGKFSELKYTHEQFLDLDQQQEIEKALGSVFGRFIEPF